MGITKMGMFDSFYLNDVKCPHCGNVAHMEFQTKQFNCAMDVWEEGKDFFCDGIIMTNGVVQDVYGGCKVKDNPDCGYQWEEKFYKGRILGFGRPVICDVKIVHGVVFGATNVRKGEE